MVCPAEQHSRNPCPGGLSRCGKRGCSRHIAAAALVAWALVPAASTSLVDARPRDGRCHVRRKSCQANKNLSCCSTEQQSRNQTCGARDLAFAPTGLLEGPPRIPKLGFECTVPGCQGAKTSRCFFATLRLCVRLATRPSPVKLRGPRSGTSDYPAERTPRYPPGWAAPGPSRRSSDGWRGCTRSACRGAWVDGSARPGSSTAC